MNGGQGGDTAGVNVERSHRFSRSWPALPESVPVARHTVVDFLNTHELADPPLSDVALAVSEAVTNAVHHAYVGDDPGEVRVLIEADPRQIRLTVEDDGRGLVPRADSPGMGLGLPLIATVCDHFDAETIPGAGTRLCMCFSCADH